MSFAVMIYSSGRLARHGLLDHAHQVRFSDNDELFTVEGDLGPGPFTEQHAVADRDVQRVKLAVFGACTRADRDDRPLHWFFLRSIGYENPARGLLLRIDAADHDAILQWTKCHQVSLERSERPLA